MKKFAIFPFALAAISTASLASQHGYDLRDSDTYFGMYSTQLKNTATKVNGLAVVKNKARAMTNIERLKKISEENGHDRH